MTRPATLVGLETLERVSRSLLARLLGPHAEFLAAHGIALDALARTEQNDRALVRRVHAALHVTEPAERAPSDALAALAMALGDLATSKGRDAILALDVPEGATGTPADACPRPRFPRGTLSNEDLAARALLDAPDLASDALDECSGASAPDEARGASELDPKDDRAFFVDDAFRSALTSLFGARMHARDRTRYCDLHDRETASAFYLELVHGKPPRARDFVRGAHADVADANDASDAALALAQSTDVVTERARARVCKLTGRLSLKANHPSLKDDLRAVIGEARFGDPDHWRLDGTCSLEAFSDFDAALAHDDVPGLDGVELHAFAVLLPWGETATFAQPRKNLTETPAKEAHALVLSLGVVVHVQLVLRMESGAKATVKITAKPKSNLLDYPRGDAAVERVVRAYLIARGVLRFGRASGRANESATGRESDAEVTGLVPRESGAPSKLAETA
jgi:hypothetical protein